MSIDKQIQDFFKKGGVITRPPIKNTAEIMAEVKATISKPDWRRNKGTVSPESEIDIEDKY